MGDVVSETLCRFAPADGGPSWSVSQHDDGRVFLHLRGQTHVLTRETQLRWHFGGLSAAIGIIPLGARALQPDGSELVLTECTLAEEWEDDDPALVPENVRDRLVAALEVVAKAAGCTLTQQ